MVRLDRPTVVGSVRPSLNIQILEIGLREPGQTQRYQDRLCSRGAGRIHRQWGHVIF